MRPKQKTLIATVAFGVLTILFSGAVVYPVFQGVVGDYAEALTYKKELVQLKENKKNSREFDILSTQYAKEFAQVDDLLIDSNTPIAFFRFLDETAASFKLQIDKVPSSVEHVPGDRWSSFDIRLAGQGSYPGFMAFLQKIENAPYLLEVQTLTLSAEKGSAAKQSQGEVEFSLSLKVFTK